MGQRATCSEKPFFSVSGPSEHQPVSLVSNKDRWFRKSSISKTILKGHSGLKLEIDMLFVVFCSILLHSITFLSFTTLKEFKTVFIFFLISTTSSM